MQSIRPARRKPGVPIYFQGEKHSIERDRLKLLMSMVALHLSEVMTSFFASLAIHTPANSNFNTSICQFLCFNFETNFLLGAVLVSAGTCGPVLTSAKEKPCLDFGEFEHPTPLSHTFCSSAKCEVSSQISNLVRCKPHAVEQLKNRQIFSSTRGAARHRGLP